jgi:hypothetical protein
VTSRFDKRPTTHIVLAQFGAFTWQGWARSLDQAYTLLDTWADEAGKAPDHAEVRVNEPLTMMLRPYPAVTP